MKYEMIFGDQSLFFDAHSDCEMAGNGHYKIDCGEVMVWNFTEKRWCNSHTNTITISAMRRIIPESKRWTMEDKKAGRLPEVGSEVSFCHVINTTFKQGVVKYIDSKIIVIETSDEIRPFVYEVDRVELNPIETLDEKAARLEDEYLNMVAKYYPDFDIPTARFIYRSQLSGELSSPVQAKDGV